MDDAYITYRYAHNIAQGHGFMYNRGEHVLGTTTPGWTLLLAAAHACGFPIERSASALGAIAGGILAGITVLVAATLGAPPALAGAAGVLWATNPLALRIDLSGMEAAAFSLLCYSALLVATLACSPRPRIIAGLLASMAVLMRPEGILVGLLVPVAAWLKNRRWKLEAAFIAVPYSVWILFAWWYFGTPIPTSVTAKLATYANGSHVETALAFARDAHFFLLHTDCSRGGAVVAGGLVLVSLLSALRGGLAQVVPVFALVYVGLYVANAPELFLWYHLPPGPGFLAAAAALVGRLWSRWLGQLPMAAGVALVALFATLAISNGLLWFSQAPDGRLFVRIEESQREASYITTARELQRLGATSETKVAAPEIGVLGWILRESPILDTVGLVSPAAIPYSRQAGGGRISADLLLDLQPDFVVMPAAFAPSISARAKLAYLYEEVARLPGASRLGSWISILKIRQQRPPSSASPPNPVAIHRALRGA